MQVNKLGVVIMISEQRSNRQNLFVNLLIYKRYLPVNHTVRGSVRWLLENPIQNTVIVHKSH